jgi:hypothetical protein
MAGISPKKIKSKEEEGSAKFGVWERLEESSSKGGWEKMGRKKRPDEK